MTNGNRMLLRNGIVLTMDPDLGDFQAADVLIEDGRIAGVGPELEADAEVLDCTGKIVIPGFVNSHLHMFQTALRSYWSDALEMDYFLQSRIEDNALFHQYTPDDVYWGQLAGALENLAAGTTTVVDTSQSSYTPAHTDAALNAMRDSGIRGVFAFSPVLGIDPNPEYAHPQDIRRLLKAESNPQGLLQLAMGYHVDPELFRIARDLNMPMFAHINDADWGEALEALESEGLLGPWCTYIHCTGLRESTWDVIKRTGGKVSVSCIVEQTLRMGKPALQAAVDLGVPVALGTDAVSLGPVDFFSQMRAAYVWQRGLQSTAEPAESGEITAISTRDILRMATLGGAQAAHVDHLVGSLTPGKCADIVVLNARALNAAPVHHAAGAIVQFMDTSNVESVLVGGHLVKAAGRLVGFRVDEVLDRLAQSASRLVQRSGRPGILFTSCRHCL